MRHWLTSLLCALPLPLAAAAPQGALEVRLEGDGALLIEGSDDPDSATLSYVSGDMVRVDPGPTGTINGTPGSQVFGPVTGDVEIKMKRGNDEVVVERIRVQGRLKVDLGEGDGRLRLFDMTVEGKLELHAKDGNDIISCGAVSVLGDAKFELGDGANDIGLDLLAGGKLELKAGDGPDMVRLYDASGALGDVKIEVGHGANSVSLLQLVARDLEVKGGDQPDFVTISGGPAPGSTSVVQGELHVHLGDGADVLVVDRATVAGRAKLHLGKGNDVVSLGPLVAGSAAAVTLRFLDKLEVKLDDGTDLLRVNQCRVEREFKAEGGNGFDVFADLGFNEFVIPPEIKDF